MLRYTLLYTFGGSGGCSVVGVDTADLERGLSSGTGGSFISFSDGVAGEGEDALCLGGDESN